MENPILRIVEKFINLFTGPGIPKLINKIKSESISTQAIIDELERLNSVTKLHENPKLEKAFRDFIKPLLDISVLEKRSCPPRQWIFLNSPPSTLDVKTEDEIGDELDFTKLIMECYSRLHYGRKTNQTKLYPICYNIGYELDVCSNEIWKTDFTFVSCRADFNDLKIKIQDFASATSRVLNHFPLVEFLSFKGYVIAGGAPLYAVRKIEWTTDTIYEGDLDLFIISNNQDNAKTIYIDLLQEIEQIINYKFPGFYSIVYLRNQHCTTCFLVSNNKSAPKMKIQIIHQIYTNQSQVVSGFDLAPCQILYNGQEFLGTYAAYVSILTNFIPVDVCTFSENIAYRLYKYSQEKEFYLIFPGLSRKAILDEVLSRNHATISVFLHSDIELISYSKTMLEDSQRQGLELDSQFFLLLREVKQEEIDYSFDFYLKSNNEIAAINTKFILAKFPIYVHADNLHEYLTNPKCNVSIDPLIRIPLSDLCVRTTKYLFGNLAKQVWDAKFDGDEVKFEAIVNEKLKEFEAIAEIERQKLQKINWKIRSIHESSQFYPLKISAREFYGDQYNGFTCSFDWPAKMQLLSAWKRKQEEKDCVFAQRLSKDLVKYIFQWVDWVNFSDTLVL